MVIRTAAMSLVVENAAEHLSRAVAAIEMRGGYVADTRQWRENGQLRATATFRVPAENLSAALDEIRKGAIRVSSESINGQDVSEEYADLTARMTNLRATETELRQLLTTVRERTQKASEILEVHNELSRIRGEIERLQGRMDYLRKMTAMSTINLELIPDVLSEPIVEPGWRPMAIARTAMRALINALKGLGGILIWIVIFVLPLAILFGILITILLWIWRSLIRWRNRHTPPMPRGPGV
jgi:hypothetical protein